MLATSDHRDPALGSQRTGQRRIEGDLYGTGNEEPSDVLCRDLGGRALSRLLDILREDVDTPEAVHILPVFQQEPIGTFHVERARIDSVVGTRVEVESIVRQWYE